MVSHIVATRGTLNYPLSLYLDNKYVLEYTSTVVSSLTQEYQILYLSGPEGEIMNQQPLWSEPQQPHYPQKMPRLYSWYTLGGLVTLYVASCVLFTIAGGGTSNPDVSKEPVLYQSLTSAGAIALLVLHGMILLIDAPNFFTLNGKIRWRSLNNWSRIGLGFVYCGFWLMPPVYLALAIKYRWEVKRQARLPLHSIVNGYVVNQQAQQYSQVAHVPDNAARTIPSYNQQYSLPRPPRRTKVFISYSHKDASYLQRLQTHFSHYERLGRVEVWNDTKLAQGAVWHEEIRKAAAQTKVAVILVSADYLASQFIVEKELPPLLHAARTEEAIIIPIILSACAFGASQLAQFQAVNDPKKPLSSMNWDETEKIWATVARIVSDAVNAPLPAQEVIKSFPWTQRGI